MNKYAKVTISGLICTGKTTLFWELQNQLFWPAYSASHFFRDYARTHKTSLDQAEEQNNKLTPEMDMHMKGLLETFPKIIVEGWMAGVMASGRTDVLRVLLTCNERERIKRFALREKVTYKRARERVLAREQNLFTKLRQIYKRDDFLETKHYNLIIETTKIPLKSVVREVRRYLV